MNKSKQTLALGVMAILGLVSGAGIVHLNHSVSVTEHSSLELEWIATCALIGQSVNYCQQQADGLKRLGYFTDVLPETEVEMDIKVEQN